MAQTDMTCSKSPNNGTNGELKAIKKGAVLDTEQIGQLIGRNILPALVDNRVLGVAT